MKSLTICLLISLLIFYSAISQSRENSGDKKYVKTPTGYLMVLRQGDDVLKEIERFAQQENLPSANFSGMGFVTITFGFFDATTKEYKPREFKDVELVSMLGSIARKERQPSVHFHGVVADKSFQSFGGHILEAHVSTGSVEILITVHDKHLERKMDETLGADVLELKH